MKTYYIYLKNGSIFTVKSCRKLDRDFFHEKNSMIVEGKDDPQTFSIRSADIAAIVSAIDENSEGTEL